MSRPKLRVIQGGAAGGPSSRGARRPAAARQEAAPAPRTRSTAPGHTERGPERRVLVRRRPVAMRIAQPTVTTWLSAILAMAGVVVAGAGHVLIGVAMALTGAAAMISPPAAPVAGRARVISLGLVAAAITLAAADIGITLLG